MEPTQDWCSESGKREAARRIQKYWRDRGLAAVYTVHTKGNQNATHVDNLAIVQAGPDWWRMTTRGAG